MGRIRTIEVGGLNMSTHPHPKGTYQKLLEYARDHEIVKQYWHNRHGMIGSLSESSNSRYLIGSFHIYTNFDPAKPWLDLKKHESADPKTVKAINIPEHIKPEFKSISFVFFPMEHRIFFNVKDAGLSSTCKMLESILNEAAASQRMNPVTVTIEQAEDSLEKIYQLPRLRTLEIEVNRPNSDNNEGATKKIGKRLERLKAKRLRQQIDAMPGESITPDEDTKTFATAALSYGHVTGKGKDGQGKTVEVSTHSHPLISPYGYRSKEQTFFEALGTKAIALLAEILGRS